ncbi:hypothetical protein KCV00_g410, partial [Aureobasidium melanogenum]
MSRFLFPSLCAWRITMIICNQLATQTLTLASGLRLPVVCPCWCAAGEHVSPLAAPVVPSSSTLWSEPDLYDISLSRCAFNMHTLSTSASIPFLTSVLNKTAAKTRDV